MIAPIVTTFRRLSSLLLASSIEDPARAVLQARSDHFSNLVTWSTVIVVVGVALEGVEIIHDVIAWAKRKRRGKRELAALKELAGVFPCGETRGQIELDSDHPRWVNRVLRVGLILVVVGVAGEWRYGAKLEDSHNAIHTYDVAKLTAAERNAGDAKDSALIAQDAATKAKDASASAVTTARGARLEADSFESDIKAAKEQATAAESHLADALERAAKAETELNQLRMPRSIVHSDELIAALRAFKGTEYTLNVFMDDESIQFTKVVARTLETAGWIRKQPKGMNIGVPTVQIAFEGGDTEYVPSCLSTGISLDAFAKESIETLNKLPAQLLPKTIQAALALKSAIALSISPSDERSVANGIVDPKPGEGIPMTICVGKKP